MRSINRYFILAAAFVSLLFVNANAQSFAARDTKPTRPLEQQVFKKLIGLPNYGLFDHITYQVNGGTVLLMGKVLSLGTRRDAENAVRRIPGVERVVNQISELPPSGFDNRIRQQLVREYVNSPGLYGYLQGSNPSVRIIVENGHVSLEGYVNNRGTASYMQALASGIPGVFSVTNNLVIEKDMRK